MEHPRDPLEEPGPYECVPQGGFRRLMLATTFESPFAKKKLGLLSPLGLDEVGGLLAWRGLAWLGLAWLGLAWLGLAWRGLAWLGLAWLGLAWLGLVLRWDFSCLDCVGFCFASSSYSGETNVCRAARRQWVRKERANLALPPSKDRAR